MRKVYGLLVLACLSSASIFAQVPSVMTYQGVLRDTSGVLIINQAIGLQISLLQGNASGTSVYVETHATTTNQNGLLTVLLGTGTVVSGDLAAVDWGNGPYYIKSEADPQGGSSYSLEGTSLMSTVPYAIIAGTAAQLTGGEQDPVFSTSAASGIDNSDITNWDNKLGSETDPLFVAAPASGISNGDITNWDNKLDAETDPVFNSSVAKGITAADTARWAQSSGGGSSEWSSNDSTVFVTKKVGIGTDAPSALLEVGNGNPGTNFISNVSGDDGGVNRAVVGNAQGSSTENQGAAFSASSEDGDANWVIGTRSQAVGGNNGIHVGVWGQGGNSNQSFAGNANYGVIGLSSESTTKQDWNNGVYGFAANNPGGNIGVDGTGGSTVGDNTGVGGYAWGVTADGENKGVFGMAEGSSTLNYGMHGEANGTNDATNTGVRGDASNSSATNKGVEGFTEGTGSFNSGVSGSAQGASNYNVGVSGYTNNGTGTSIAVRGINDANGTWNYGGWYESRGVGANANTGIYSLTKNSTTNNTSIYALSEGTGTYNLGVNALANGVGGLLNIGVQGWAQGSLSENQGGGFYATSTAGNANWVIGAKGRAFGTNVAIHTGLLGEGGEPSKFNISNTAFYGVTGISTQENSGKDNHTGVYGYSSNNSSANIGVDGTADSEIGNNNGVGGFAYGATTGENKGLFGYVNKAGATNYAVFGQVDGGSGTSLINYSGYFKGAPVAIEDDNIYVKDFNKGVVLTSPNGQCWQVKVGDTGTLTTTSVTCPN